MGRTGSMLLQRHQEEQESFLEAAKLITVRAAALAQASGVEPKFIVQQALLPKVCFILWHVVQFGGSLVGLKA